MINVLESTFDMLITKLLRNCREKGVEMIPYEKLRSPYIQANYWKQGRTNDEIAATLEYLAKEQAFFLLHCIEVATPSAGPKITNALPGCSWHQWGKAIDCYWFEKGKKNWNLDVINEYGENGYKVYAQEAQKLKLDAGYFWSTNCDAVHVQHHKTSSPLKVYSLREINETMEYYFAD
ncbi:M15 family metallopeptidase [Chitinophagaceae bacterium LWZ2-11]